MIYEQIVQARFLERPNRFIAHCQIDQKIVLAHVKNTGRCKELLVAGATVYLEYAPSSTRKTAYSLIAVKKDQYLINIDSQIPNEVALEGIKEGLISLPGISEKISLLKREVTYGHSRLDLYLQTKSGIKVFIEVKGVTLEANKVVKFPDAPTKRGTKHLYELIEAKKAGYEVYVLFVIQMTGVSYFKPNQEMDVEFAIALEAARKEGVHILAYDCLVTPERIKINQAVEVRM